jgi:hypothetical protein
MKRLCESKELPLQFSEDAKTKLQNLVLEIVKLPIAEDNGAMQCFLKLQKDISDAEHVNYLMFSKSYTGVRAKIAELFKQAVQFPQVLYVSQETADQAESLALGQIMKLDVEARQKAYNVYAQDVMAKKNAKEKEWEKDSLLVEAAIGAQMEQQSDGRCQKRGDEDLATWILKNQKVNLDKDYDLFIGSFLAPFYIRVELSFPPCYHNRFSYKSH